MSVDLPEPDGPMIAVKRPAGKATLTPARACTAASPSPKTRETPAASTSGVPSEVMARSVANRPGGQGGGSPRIV